MHGSDDRDTFANGRRLRRGATIAVTLVAGLLGGCWHSGRWHGTDVTGAYPPLALTMSRVPDGRPITATDFRGQVVLLYFGFSKCQNVCPVTLANVQRVFDDLGPAGQHVRVVFVTVDPHRDTPPVLAAFLRRFGPEMVGLRGDSDQLTALARRYRVGFRVTKNSPGQPYLVTHSSAIYVFDASGKARLLVSSLSSAHPDIAGVAADLKRLVNGRAI